MFRRRARGVPDLLAERVTAELDIPTIGIGAGPACDGQVIVLHDLLGLSESKAPKFVRRYAELGSVGTEAVRAWAADVRAGGIRPRQSRTTHRQSCARRSVRRPEQSRSAVVTPVCDALSVDEDLRQVRPASATMMTSPIPLPRPNRGPERLARRVRRR